MKNEYTAKELSLIFGCTQQTIINRCKRGDFHGSEKRKSPYGYQWFIPHEAINNYAQEIVPVLKVERQITLKDFEGVFKDTLMPLIETHQKVLEDNQRLQEKVDELSKTIQNMESRDREILNQIRAIQEKNKKSFWQRFFKNA